MTFLLNLFRAVLALFHPASVPVSQPSKGTPMALDTAKLLADAKAAAESALESGIQNFITTEFGATASADALKLMNDIVALAKAPSLSAALADLPDVLALVMVIATPAPAT